MTFKPIFSPFFYQKQLDNHQEVKDKMEERFLAWSSQLGDSKVPESWNAKLVTSFEEREEQIWKDFFPMVNPTVKEFIETFYTGAYDTIVTGIWFNHYRKGDSQDRHNHAPGSYSAIYFLKYNSEVHTPPVFTNPLSDIMSYWDAGLDEPGNNYPSSLKNQKALLTVDEGDILIFPSFLDHEVFPQTTDEDRLTISFNFNVGRKRN